MAVIEQQIEENYAIYNGDCIEGMQDMPSGSIHHSIYSPPFLDRKGSGLYHYSSSERDLSNSKNIKEGMEHYGYVVREIERLTMPGRCTAVHCTDTPSGNSGRDHLFDYPGEIIRLHERLGFDWIARHTIWKEPLWVRNRTMTKNLAHKTICTDATNAGVASADYLLVFRKRGKNPIPVAHTRGLNYYAGECPMPADILRYKNWEGNQIENKFSHWIWRRYASSVWDDIRMGRVLPYRDCKEPDDEKHVHPLQLDVIERDVQLRTLPGETVLTAFMGVGSEVYGAVRAGRKGIGFELKSSYFRQSIENMKLALIPEPSEDGVIEMDFSDDEDDV